jgi:hypothetical protein
MEMFMSVVIFAEEYFIRCKAIERAEEVLPAIMQEATALVDMSEEEKAAILRRKLVKEFYSQEKKKWQEAKNDSRFGYLQNSKTHY